MSPRNRIRMTITMRKDLVQAIDQVIDGARIRNRSHAIEYVLSKSLNPGIKKALILAGGHGIKMRPFTYEMPKPMILVKGRPILEYVIQKLRDSGIRDIIILLGPLGEKIIQHFGDGSRYGVAITYIDEKEATGTGGSLKKAAKFFKETFIMIYGDVLADIDLYEFIEFHSLAHGIASIALSTAVDTSDYGVVKLRGAKVVDFIEKPSKGEKLTGLVSAGIHIFEPQIFELIPDTNKKISLEKEIFPKLIKIGKINGYPFEGQWFDVSTPLIYEKVIKEWNY